MFLNVTEKMQRRKILYKVSWVITTWCIIMPSAYIRRSYKGDGEMARRVLRKTAPSYRNHNKVLTVFSSFVDFIARRNT